MYKKIMLATDGSKYSEAALEEAIDVAKIFDSNVTILNVIDINNEILKVSPELSDKLALQAKEIIDKAQRKMREADIKINTVIKEGDPHEIIPQLAMQEGIDLIIMGTYGRKGLKLLLMGSVAADVVCHASCDVLVVKERVKAANRNKKYQSILVPYDGSEFSKTALEQACQIVKINQGEISVFYVIPRYEEVLEFFKTNWMKEILMCEAKAIVKQAQEVALKNGISIKTRIESENHVDAKIVEAAKKSKTDIIIMGVRGLGNLDRIIMGSVIERVIINAPCPILVIKKH